MRNLRLQTGDVTLQVREYEREAIPIIFLHFGGGNLMMWQRVIPTFQEAYRLILLDLRDHGKSDKPQKDIHIDDMAGDVVGIMDHLKLEQAHIIGSSLGAEVGLSLAANYPERVLTLVCEGAFFSEYGPYGIWTGSEAQFKEYTARAIAEVHDAPQAVFNSADALAEAEKPAFERAGWWNEYVAAFLKYDAFEIGEGRFTRSWQNPAIEKYMRHYFEYRFEDYYRRVKCPLILLPGEEELKNERTKSVMQGLIQLAPGGKIVTVPGWIHPYGWLIDPEEMCKVVLKFLEES